MYTKITFNKDWRQKIESLLTRGGYVIGSNGRLKMRSVSGAYDTPWIFTDNSSRHKFCNHWNAIYNGIFKIIPSHCRFACWKTVIKPRDLKELFELYETMLSLELPGKCGADRRNYTYGAWAGFVYADSLRQGREYYARVREVVPDNIPVILKRGCTEMERQISSDQWDDLDYMYELEFRLDDLFDHTEHDNFKQSAWVKNEIKAKWIERAIEIGDPTAREMAEKHSTEPDIWNKLVVHSSTYHNPPKPKRTRDIHGRFAKEK